MVVFADPDFAGAERRVAGGAGLYLAPIPSTRLQANAFAAEARDWHWPIETYLGSDATESRLRSLHSPRILHLVTHGFFLADTKKADRSLKSRPSLWAEGSPFKIQLRNPMLRSGIALAGAQATLDAWERGEVPPTDNDGILTAEEVGTLDLQGTWLVALSACDTGLGEEKSGEGVMGLRRGFVQAGVQNLLMTLWPVFGPPSTELMVDFYSKLHQDNNPSAALAEVQRDALVKLRSRHGLRQAVVAAGAFVLSTEGPAQ
jgi:CHAT domain-containing protein